jgi:hemerythrin
MNYLKWSPDFSVGIDAVDFEHQNLIEDINLVLAELQDRRDIDLVVASIAEIHSEVAAHFALEERIMRAADYEEYDAHKNDHEDLLDQLRGLMDMTERDPDWALKSLSDELSKWFSNHFQSFDARLHGKLGH